MNVHRKINLEKSTFKKWFLYKMCYVFIMAISAEYVYFVLFTMGVFGKYSLLRWGEVIEFYGKVIICVGGISMFIWCFFSALRSLLNKDIGPVIKSTTIGSAWLVFSLLSLFLGYIVVLLLSVIFMFSSYTSCHEKKFAVYYVDRPELCQTIVPDHW